MWRLNYKRVRNSIPNVTFFLGVQTPHTKIAVNKNSQKHYNVTEKLRLLAYVITSVTSSLNSCWYPIRKAMTFSPWLFNLKVYWV